MFLRKLHFPNDILQRKISKWPAPTPALSPTEQRKGWEMRWVRPRGRLKIKYWRWLLRRAGTCSQRASRRPLTWPQKTGASQVPAPQAAGPRSPEGLGRVTQSPGATHLCQRQGTRPNRPSSAKHAHTGSVWSVCLLQQAEVLSLGPFLWGGRGGKTYETILVKGNAFLFLLTVVRC